MKTFSTPAPSETPTQTTTLKCCSFVPKAAIIELLSKGVLRCKEEHIEIPMWIPAYKWMRSQMIQRIGKPPESDLYPIWVWHMWEGKVGHQPISNFNYDRMRNQDFGIFRIDLEVPKEKILLSNWDTWSAPLCGSHLDTTEEEFEKDHWSRSEIRSSWGKIFDIENIEYNKFYGPKTLSIQGCLWEVTPDMVKKIQSFGPLKPTREFLTHEKMQREFDEAYKWAKERES